jgi:outer membrane cobalamin receptor
MRSWTDESWVDAGRARGRCVSRPLRRLGKAHGVAALGLLCAVGCGGARAGSERSSTPSAGKVITAEMIAASGAKTAWDAVRKTVPNVQLRERDGQPARIVRRGRASIYLDDQVRVILDNTPVYDIRVLDQVPASNVLSIEVLNGLDATTHYGGTSTSGVIIIRTKNGSE